VGVGQDLLEKILSLEGMLLQAQELISAQRERILQLQLEPSSPKNGEIADQEEKDPQKNEIGKDEFASESNITDDSSIHNKDSLIVDNAASDKLEQVFKIFEI